VYACSQYGSCGRSTNAGSTVRSFGTTTASRRAWLTPLALDPSNPAIVYYGGDRLNRSTNSAQSFAAISGDLSHGGGGASGNYDTISAIAVAKTDGRIIYAGRHRRRPPVDHPRHRHDVDGDHRRAAEPVDHPGRRRPDGREHRVRHPVRLPQR
jgi:hypothetical protein